MPDDTLKLRDLDIRPLIATGGEPFQVIMAAVAALSPGEGIRLVAPFRPIPLLRLMADRGFAARERALEGGAWEVVFSPETPAPRMDGLATGSSPLAAGWKDPIEALDLRDLVPPEPLAPLLETLEMLREGDVVFVLLSGEPVRLFPELARRGHEWAGNFDAAGIDYRLMVRHGGF